MFPSPYNYVLSLKINFLSLTVQIREGKPKTKRLEINRTFRKLQSTGVHSPSTVTIVFKYCRLTKTIIADDYKLSRWRLKMNVSKSHIEPYTRISFNSFVIT